jgi:hypothetical protein
MKALHAQWVSIQTFGILGEEGRIHSIALRQRLQQRLGLQEVSGVKALGEPAIDGCQ